MWSLLCFECAVPRVVFVDRVSRTPDPELEVCPRLRWLSRRCGLFELQTLHPTSHGLFLDAGTGKRAVGSQLSSLSIRSPFEIEAGGLQL